MLTSIIVNGSPVSLPDEVKTVAQLLEWKNIPTGGTAVAVNSRLVTAANHKTAILAEGDVVTIISAAYGG